MWVCCWLGVEVLFDDDFSVALLVDEGTLPASDLLTTVWQFTAEFLLSFSSGRLLASLLPPGWDLTVVFWIDDLTVVFWIDCKTLCTYHNFTTWHTNDTIYSKIDCCQSNWLLQFCACSYLLYEVPCCFCCYCHSYWFAVCAAPYHMIISLTSEWVQLYTTLKI